MKFPRYLITAAMSVCLVILATENVFAFDPSRTRFSCHAYCMATDWSERQVVSLGLKLGVSNFDREEAFQLLARNCATSARTLKLETAVLVKKLIYRTEQIGWWSYLRAGVQPITADEACTEDESVPIGPPQYMGEDAFG